MAVSGQDASSGANPPSGGASGASDSGGTFAAGSGGHSGVGGSPSADAKSATGQGGASSDGRPPSTAAAGGAAAGGAAVGGGATAGGAAAGGNGGSGTGGKGGTGGAVTRDAAQLADATTSDAAMPGAPTIDPNSGYATVSAGAVIMSGYVSSYVGGSGSSISLSYTPTTFCASGTVAANSTYNSWAGVGFNVNQAKSGSSGSTGQLVLVGSTLSISYVNRAGSTLDLQLWDGSNYWCYRLPPSTVPSTVTIPLSSLNTQCWDGAGSAFTSGTSITTVQLDVPGSATTPTPFDYCFLGLTVQ